MSRKSVVANDKRNSFGNRSPKILHLFTYSFILLSNIELVCLSTASENVKWSLTNLLSYGNILRQTWPELKGPLIGLLGNFAKLPKMFIKFVISVCPSVRMEQLRSLNLTFIGPCFANIFAEYNQQDATFHNLFISVRRSTCFRRFFRPTSGA